MDEPIRLEYLIDTNVFSYIFNGHSFAKPYESLLGERKSAISFITLGESLAGAALGGWGVPRQRNLQIALAEYTVLESNRLVAEHFATINAFLRLEGRPPTSNDAWIAATALAYELPLVSHNRRHFDGIPGLDLVSFAL